MIEKNLDDTFQALVDKYKKNKDAKKKEEMKEN